MNALQQFSYALCLLLLASAASAQDKTRPIHGDAGAAFAIGLSIDAPWYSDSGYDVFDDDDVSSRFGLWVAYDVLTLPRDIFAAVEIGVGTESESSDLLGNTLQSDLLTRTLHAGVQVRWVPWDMLQPHARLALGAAFVDMTLDAQSPQEHFSDDGVSPFASLGLGVTLRTPTRSFETEKGNYASLSFGVMLEGGYTLAGPLSFQLDGSGPNVRDIELIEADLGELDRSGPYVRVSLVSRF